MWFLTFKRCLSFLLCYLFYLFNCFQCPFSLANGFIIYSLLFRTSTLGTSHFMKPPFFSCSSIFCYLFFTFCCCFVLRGGWATLLSLLFLSLSRKPSLKVRHLFCMVRYALRWRPWRHLASIKDVGSSIKYTWAALSIYITPTRIWAGLYQLKGPVEDTEWAPPLSTL